MYLIPGKYQHTANVGVKEFFEALGVPFLERISATVTSPLIEVYLDGDTVTVKSTAVLVKHTQSFKTNQEYEDWMGSIALKSKTVVVNESEMLTTSVIEKSKETFQRHYLFTDDELIETFTSEKVTTKCERHFQRLI